MYEVADLFNIFKNIAYLIEVLLLIFGAKWILDFINTYSLKEELTTRDNTAVALSTVGYLVGVAIICVSVTLGESPSFLMGVIDIAGYGFLGMALLFFARIINDKFILYSFSIRKELVEDKNAGTGAVVLGNYIASAMYVGGAVAGEGGGLLSTLIFFILGQVFLILYSYIYEWITPFDVHKKIEADNVAVGISFAGSLIAIGIILRKAAIEDFVGFIANLTDFLLYGILSFVLLIIVRYFFIKFFIIGVDLNKEIGEDGNVGVALIEAAITIVLAAGIYYII